MTELKYPDAEGLELLHKILVQKWIDKWKWWLHWYHWKRTIRDLESIIDFIKWDNYYPKFSDKLAHLMFSLNKNHIFNDGNKRISVYSAISFMMLNILEEDHLIEETLRELENIASGVANDRVTSDELKIIFEKFLLKFNSTKRLSNI